MSILTNFLKLVKPEKNDYVDVEEHISNNYDKIDTWARDLVINDLENGGVDKALAANQGVVLDNKDVGIMGGRDGKFPLTAATKGNIYLLESTQKYYICINDYDGIQISVPNANFEELSVYTNRSKLDNLSRKSVSFGVGTEKEFNISKLNIKNGIYLISSLDIGGDTNAPVTIGLLRYHTINSYSLFVPITSSNENVYGYIDTTDGVILKFNNSSSILNRNYTIWIDCIS